MPSGTWLWVLSLLAAPTGFLLSQPQARWACAATSPAALAHLSQVRTQLGTGSADEASVDMAAPVLLKADPTEIRAWIQNQESRYILLLGTMAAAVVSAPEFSTEKKIVAGFFHDPALFGMAAAPFQNKPGINLILPGNRLGRDLAHFQALIGADQVAIVLDAELHERFSGLSQSVKDAGQALGLKLVLVPSTSVEQTLGAVDTAAAYLGPLPHLSPSQREALFRSLSERGVFTFAMTGLDAVVQGAFAGAVVDARDNLVNRLTEHVSAVTRGERPEYLPSFLPLPERLTINGKTAAALNYEMTLERQMLADWRFGEGVGEGETLYLTTVIEQALAANPELAAERQRALGADYARKAAFSALLPQVNADTRYVRNNDDNPQIAAGLSPETQTTAAVNGSQVIFDDAKWSDAGVARFEARAAQTRVDVLANSIIDETASAFLDVLVSEALVDIEIENLKRTRANLATARARVRLGAAGREEAFRWESQVAQQSGTVYNTHAQVLAAKASLESLLGGSLTQSPWRADPRGLTAEDSLFLSPRWVRLLEEEGPRLSRYLADLAIDRSPDVMGADLQVQIARRRETSAKRSFFLPKVQLEAGLTDFVDQEFLASDGGIPGLSLAQEGENWSVTLSASIPIFSGGRRIHDLGRTRAVRREAVDRQSFSQLRVRESTLFSMAALQASQPNIALTQLAADNAAKNLDIVAANYAQGKASILDLLEAQEQDLARQRQAAVAEYTHLANLFSLQRSLALFDWRLSPAERIDFLDQLEADIRTRPSPQQRRP